MTDHEPDDRSPGTDDAHDGGAEVPADLSDVPNKEHEPVVDPDSIDVVPDVHEVLPDDDPLGVVPGTREHDRGPDHPEDEPAEAPPG